MKRPMVLTDWRGETRAGWTDARRTTRPVTWHGFRWGDVFYGTGYALGALS